MAAPSQQLPAQSSLPSAGETLPGVLPTQRRSSAGSSFGLPLGGFPPRLPDPRSAGKPPGVSSGGLGAPSFRSSQQQPLPPHHQQQPHPPPTAQQQQRFSAPVPPATLPSSSGGGKGGGVGVSSGVAPSPLPFSSQSSSGLPPRVPPLALQEGSAAGPPQPPLDRSFKPRENAGAPLGGAAAPDVRPAIAPVGDWTEVIQRAKELRVRVKPPAGVGTGGSRGRQEGSQHQQQKQQQPPSQAEEQSLGGSSSSSLTAKRLAGAEPFASSNTAELQRVVDSLVAENRRLQQQVETLKQQPQQQSSEPPEGVATLSREAKLRAEETHKRLVQMQQEELRLRERVETLRRAAQEEAQRATSSGVEEEVRALKRELDEARNTSLEQQKQFKALRERLALQNQELEQQRRRIAELEGRTARRRAASRSASSSRLASQLKSLHEEVGRIRRHHAASLEALGEGHSVREAAAVGSRALSAIDELIEDLQQQQQQDDDARPAGGRTLNAPPPPSPACSSSASLRRGSLSSRCSYSSSGNSLVTMLQAIDRIQDLYHKHKQVAAAARQRQCSERSLQRSSFSSLAARLAAVTPSAAGGASPNTPSHLSVASLPVSQPPLLTPWSCAPATQPLKEQRLVFSRGGNAPSVLQRSVLDTTPLSKDLASQPPLSQETPQQGSESVFGVSFFAPPSPSRPARQNPLSEAETQQQRRQRSAEGSSHERQPSLENALLAFGSSCEGEAFERHQQEASAVGEQPEPQSFSQNSFQQTQTYQQQRYQPPQQQPHPQQLPFQQRHAYPQQPPYAQRQQHPYEQQPMHPQQPHRSDEAPSQADLPSAERDSAGLLGNAQGEGEEDAALKAARTECLGAGGLRREDAVGTSTTSAGVCSSQQLSPAPLPPSLALTPSQLEFETQEQPSVARSSSSLLLNHQGSEDATLAASAVFNEKSSPERRALDARSTVSAQLLQDNSRDAFVASAAAAALPPRGQDGFPSQQRPTEVSAFQESNRQSEAEASFDFEQSCPTPGMRMQQQRETQGHVLFAPIQQPATAAQNKGFLGGSPVSSEAACEMWNAIQQQHSQQEQTQRQQQESRRSSGVRTVDELFA